MNEIVTEDGILGIGDSSNTTTFLEYEKFNIYDMAKNPREMQVNINLNRVNIQYNRKVYTFFDALGDAGGLFEAIIIISGLMVAPFYHQIQSVEFARDLISKNNKDHP